MSVLAVGAVEVAVRATAAYRKQLWGSLVLGRDYKKNGEWEFHLVSEAGIKTHSARATTTTTTIATST